MKRVLLAILLFLPLSCTVENGTNRPKNVIFFISDGCGPASFTFARDFLRATGQGEELSMDPYHSGAVKTHSSDSYITDSAASATAYACGIKTYNGAIGVADDHSEVATLVERAEAAGWNTGLVSTARITHATPASFSSHVENRNMEADIASQQITKGIEVLLGGGSEWYLPEEAGGEREDGRNLLEELRSTGAHVVSDRNALLAEEGLPIVGLFTNSHMSYEIDRDAGSEPSLADMTRKSLDLLSSSDTPFFIMIEAGRIDHAAHSNDAAAHLRDILAYDEAFRTALEFAAADGHTLIVATSDHETGGLTLGAEHPDLNSYAYEPSPLSGITSSTERWEADLRERIQADVSLDGLADWMLEELPVRFDTTSLFEPMADRIHTGLEQVMTGSNSRGLAFLSAQIRRMEDERSRIGWSTGGHTAVDVPLFAHGPGAGRFAGVLDNTQISIRLAEAMGLEGSR